ncbi:MAG: 16S rRNA (uracil(1498)-N(3))-methyltransferase [Bacteroidales bacterium]|nr:16S rRNA (uracil(1498)-N(3))-methyltransferase [Bacteroidales bacterium]
MHVFYSPITDGPMLILSEEESHHAVKVLRLRPGQQIVVTDGLGKWIEGELAETNARTCVVNISRRSEQPPRPFRLHMAVAPTKNIDRFEWFLEKATECGIDEITPVFCENSERHVIKAERLEKVLVAAMKQSMRAYLPILNPAMKLKDFLKQEVKGSRIIAHCGNGARNILQNVYEQGQDTVVLIGPEGDFSETEVNISLEAGYAPITLGQHRLRTETAALALCINLNFVNGLL